jgi:hypothetical protein
MTPANTPVTMDAPPASPVTRPIWTTEPVTCRTRSGIATNENASPAVERICTNQKMFRSRLPVLDCRATASS